MKKSLISTLLLTAGALSLAPLAHANPIATYSIAGGANGSGTISSGNSVTSTDGSILISQFTDFSNSPGTGSLSFLTGASANIQNTGSSAETVELTISDSGFTTPNTPPDLILSSAIGGSITNGVSLSTLSYSSSAGGNTTGALTPDITSSGSYNANNDLTITSLTGPFALGETIDFNLAAGEIVNFSSSTDLRPVPEPSTFALFGVGLLGCALFLGRRRSWNV